MSGVLDLADQAEAAEQRFRDAALSVRKPIPKPTGKCYFCNEELSGSALFCPPDPEAPEDSCARNYDALQAARKRNGR